MNSARLALFDRILFAMVETSLPANIGSAARAMKTMGLSRLVLVLPRSFPHAQATALAAGADDVLNNALVCDALASGLANCRFSLGCTARSRTVGLPVFSLREAAGRLLQEAERGEVAVLFGSERVGLSNADISRCDGAVSIDTDPDFSSLNVAQAVQLMAYELRMEALAGQPSRLAASRYEEARDVAATLAELEEYFSHLEQALAAIDFYKGRSPRLIMQRLRRLFLRATLSQREVQLLHGILRDAERQARLALNTPTVTSNKVPDE